MYEAMCCDFRFAIAKVLILPKAKKLLCLNFTNAAKGFFQSQIHPFYSFTFYPFTFKSPFLLFYSFTFKCLFTLLLFYFFTFICTFA